ncbi:MAG: RloB domain-containing protein [Suipraeoptans sp.]
MKKKQQRGEDIQGYIDKGVAFKDVTFKAFGVQISNEKDFHDKESSLFIIYCGGAKDEKAYLSYIIDYPKYFRKVKIRYITGTDQIDELVEQAINDIKNGFGGVYNDDVIYLLTDMDTFRDDIIMQKPICISNNINLIVSNPCFEI